VRLRVQSEAGARYVGHLVLESVQNGTTIRIASETQLEVERVEAGVFSLLSTTQSLQTIDDDGNPTPTALPFDATQVTTRYGIDESGHRASDVVVEGAPPPFDVMFRQAVEASAMHWPQTPVAVGDSWDDPSEAHASAAGIDMTLHCSVHSTITGFGGPPDDRVASVETLGECLSEPIPVPQTEGQQAEVFLRVRTTSTSRSEVSVRDAMVVTTHTETDTAVSIVGQGRDSVPVQEATQTLDFTVERVL
jgi:hypothetical protein